MGKRRHSSLSSNCCHPCRALSLCSLPAVLSAVGVALSLGSVQHPPYRPSAMTPRQGGVGVGVEHQGSASPPAHCSAPATGLLAGRVHRELCLHFSLSGRFSLQISMRLTPSLPWISAQMSTYQLSPSLANHRKRVALLPNHLHSSPLSPLSSFTVLIIIWQFTCLLLYFLSF